MYLGPLWDFVRAREEELVAREEELAAKKLESRATFESEVRQKVESITLKDILRIQPELFEIAKEHNAIKEIREESAKIKRIKKPENFKESICEECGNYEFLSNEDGRLICKSCRDAM